MKKMKTDDRPVDIRKRTFAFAVRIVKLCNHLFGKPGVSRILASQLLNADTSVLPFSFFFFTSRKRATVRQRQKP